MPKKWINRPFLYLDTVVNHFLLSCRTTEIYTMSL